MSSINTTNTKDKGQSFQFRGVMSIFCIFLMHCICKMNIKDNCYAWNLSKSDGILPQKRDQGENRIQRIILNEKGSSFL